MRPDAGIKLLLVLVLSASVALVSGPHHSRDRRDAEATEVQAADSASKPELICPSQCIPENNVLLCHHADGLNVIQLAQCVHSTPAISVVELRSAREMCFCELLDYIRLTSDSKVLTFTTEPCGETLFQNCRSMLPERAQNMENVGMVAGLVMEESEAGWRRATKHHLTWVWEAISSLEPENARLRYRALVIGIVKSAYWTKNGMSGSKSDLILPFMLYKSGHLGSLYEGGRKGWKALRDYRQSAGDDWYSMNNRQQRFDETEYAATRGQAKGNPANGNQVDIIHEIEMPNGKKQKIKIEAVRMPSAARKPVHEESVGLQGDAFSSRRMTLVVAVICLVVAICIICIIIHLCRGRRDGSLHRTKSASFDDEDSDDTFRKKSIPDHIDEKMDSAEIQRRLSLPYSKWSADDFERARELQKEREQKSLGVKQKIPEDKLAQYRRLQMGKPRLSQAGASPCVGNKEKVNVWTQVNVFDIIDEVDKTKGLGLIPQRHIPSIKKEIVPSMMPISQSTTSSTASSASTMMAKQTPSPTKKKNGMEPSKPSGAPAASPAAAMPTGGQSDSASTSPVEVSMESRESASDKKKEKKKKKKKKDDDKKPGEGGNDKKPPDAGGEDKADKEKRTSSASKEKPESKETKGEAGKESKTPAAVDTSKAPAEEGEKKEKKEKKKKRRKSKSKDRKASKTDAEGGGAEKHKKEKKKKSKDRLVGEDAGKETKTPAEGAAKSKASLEGSAKPEASSEGSAKPEVSAGADAKEGDKDSKKKKKKKKKKGSKSEGSVGSESTASEGSTAEADKHKKKKKKKKKGSKSEGSVGSESKASEGSTAESDPGDKADKHKKKKKKKKGSKSEGSVGSESTASEGSAAESDPEHKKGKGKKKKKKKDSKSARMASRYYRSSGSERNRSHSASSRNNSSSSRGSSRESSCSEMTSLGARYKDVVTLIDWGKKGFSEAHNFRIFRSRRPSKGQLKRQKAEQFAPKSSDTETTETSSCKKNKITFGPEVPAVQSTPQSPRAFVPVRPRNSLSKHSPPVDQILWEHHADDSSRQPWTCEQIRCTATASTTTTTEYCLGLHSTDSETTMTDRKMVCLYCSLFEDNGASLCTQSWADDDQFLQTCLASAKPKPCICFGLHDDHRCPLEDHKCPPEDEVKGSFFNEVMSQLSAMSVKGSPNISETHIHPITSRSNNLTPLGNDSSPRADRDVLTHSEVNVGQPGCRSRQLSPICSAQNQSVGDCVHLQTSVPTSPRNLELRARSISTSPCSSELRARSISTSPRNSELRAGSISTSPRNSELRAGRNSPDLQRIQSRKQDLPSVRFTIANKAEGDYMDPKEKAVPNPSSPQLPLLPSPSEIERFVQGLKATSPELFTELSSQVLRIEKERMKNTQSLNDISENASTPRPHKLHSSRSVSAADHLRARKCTYRKKEHTKTCKKQKSPRPYHCFNKSSNNAQYWSSAHKVTGPTVSRSNSLHFASNSSVCRMSQVITSSPTSSVSIHTGETTTWVSQSRELELCLSDSSIIKAKQSCCLDQNEHLQLQEILHQNTNFASVVRTSEQSLLFHDGKAS